MPKGLVRYFLFLLAYIPIYFIAALKTIDTSTHNNLDQKLTTGEIIVNNIIPISLVGLSILLILYFLVYRYFAMRPKGVPIFEVREIKVNHKEYVTYLGTYILPFVALETNSTLDMIAVAFMFLTIGFIFSKTNLIYTNPTLVLFGYDIYEVTDSTGKIYDCIIRSKHNIQSGDKPKGIRLGPGTYVIAK